MPSHFTSSVLLQTLPDIGGGSEADYSGISTGLSGTFNESSRADDT